MIKKDNFMSAIRFAPVWLLLASALLLFDPEVARADISVGKMIVNQEGGFTPTATNLSAPVTLNKNGRVLAHFASQFAADFGIISAADLQKWRSGQPVAYLARLTGTAGVRYVNLAKGSYYAVIRNQTGGVAYNGFCIKVRRFTGIATEGGVEVGSFISGTPYSFNVLPVNWQGNRMAVPAGSRVYFQAAFARPQPNGDPTDDVVWQLVTETEYQKYLSRLPYTTVRRGKDPTTVQFELPQGLGKLYFLVINKSTTPSAYSAAREIYN
jgi:hypothetical protein